MNLKTEHLKLTPDGVIHERVADMREMDYRPEYEQIWVVESKSSPGTYYLCAKITVLDRPFPDADEVVDRKPRFVCSCGDYYFRKSNGIENGERKPWELDVCKHLESELKAERAKEDESQSQLGDVC